MDAGQRGGPAQGTEDARARFMAAVAEAIRTRQLLRLVLSKPATRVLAEGFEGEGPVLMRVRIQPVRLKHGVRLGFHWQYDTRDQRSNLDEAESLATVDRLLSEVMRVAVLETPDRITELGFSKRGRPLMRSRRQSASVESGAAMSEPSVLPPSSSQRLSPQPKGRSASATRAVSRSETPGASRPEAAQDEALPAEPVADDWPGLDQHNRDKHRLIRIDRPYLVDLGVTGQGVCWCRPWRANGVRSTSSSRFWCRPGAITRPVSSWAGRGNCRCASGILGRARAI